MPRKETNPINSVDEQSSTADERSSTFESEFERMTTIVDKLERGNVPFGEMLALYEEAMTLSAKLKEVLNEAELRVEKLAAVHEELAGPRIEANDILENEDLF